MLGFFSLFHERQNVVKNEEISFVSFPDGLSKEELKLKFSKRAKEFADFLNVNKVYLNYGKEDFIEYDYSI